MDEISTLCGIQACAIVYGQNDPQPDMWPSPEGVNTVLSRFRRLPETEQTKRMQDQESFLREKIQKGQEQLNKLKNENRKKELTQLMFQCLNAGQVVDNVGSMRDLHGLNWLVDHNLKQIERRMEEMRVAPVVENRAENVVGMQQGNVMVVENRAGNVIGREQGNVMVGREQGNMMVVENRAENMIGREQGNVMVGREQENMMVVENHAENVIGMAQGNMMVVDNRAENVMGREQGMENNVNAMQTEQLPFDFMTNNNNFGDVLSFDNGHNVPNFWP
ncbi:hypothetical protein TSUD_124840 [Trifolium subterraneum]|uniref:MADS-box domain-containing protein n=1 Tax=Trifolium subterraneum TaxID=3900 RepID=A0A2Z6LQK7_TRISU|nr:hypothetical protein TSUD_124840 [Trifolium subterraneum]